MLEYLTKKDVLQNYFFEYQVKINSYKTLDVLIFDEWSKTRFYCFEKKENDYLH
jgi:hypothetical protein